MSNRVVVILGPTAVGKTALAVELARRLRTEIISGDSMLVYRGMDIGTAKPDAAERRGVRHHLIDILSPVENYSVAVFCRQAGELIKDVNRRGMVPILAGGTGLYVQALLEGYDFNRQAADEAYRAEMEKLAEERGKIALLDLLRQIAPATADELADRDVRRIIRALEVARLGGETISRRRAYDGGELAFDAKVIGLRRERRALYERIDRRVDMMMAAGLADEVETLLNSGVPPDAKGMKGIGYKELVAARRGEITTEQAVYEIKKASRHFAKRQITWYNRMSYIHWLDVDDLTTEQAADRAMDVLAGFLG